MKRLTPLRSSSTGVAETAEAANAAAMIADVNMMRSKSVWERLVEEDNV